MFGAPVQSGLTLSKVISGLTKTLGFANRVIPLYREAKPMIQNARTILSTLREMGKSTNSNTSTKRTNNINNNTQNEKRIVRNTNNPTFFA